MATYLLMYFMAGLFASQVDMWSSDITYKDMFEEYGYSTGISLILIHLFLMVIFWPLYIIDSIFGD